MNQETIKAAEEYAVGKSSEGVFQKAHIDDFLAGAEYQMKQHQIDLDRTFKSAVECGRREKQQQIDELVTELKYARRYLNGFEHDVHTIDELIQKHRP